MLFLIDYENVGNAGMKGCYYLGASDHIIIFYSESKRNMERRILEDIVNSGCVFEACKLCKKGKNALDFYIASRVGEMFGGGYAEITVIVSRDTGFLSVRDYWDKRAVHKRKVLLANCVEDGIVSSNENSDRGRELRQFRENLSIGGFLADYTEKMRIRAVIKGLFEGTEYEGKTEEIQKLMEGKDKSPKAIYLNCLPFSQYQCVL